jgi:hypothetical protein
VALGKVLFGATGTLSHKVDGSGEEHILYMFLHLLVQRETAAVSRDKLCFAPAAALGEFLYVLYTSLILLFSQSLQHCPLNNYSPAYNVKNPYLHFHFRSSLFIQ